MGDVDREERPAKALLKCMIHDGQVVPWALEKIDLFKLEVLFATPYNVILRG
jgi:hypothetical protein